MRRLQNQIARSRLTLLGSVVLTSIVWLVATLHTSPWVVLPWGLVMLATYLTVALNRHHTLLRTYSRMPSTTLMAMACYFLPTLVRPEGVVGCAIAVLFLTCLWMLLEAYQDPRSPGRVFIGFSCIGLASWWQPQILFLVPFIWVLLKAKIAALSLRTVMASLLGLLLPYWLIGSYIFVKYKHVNWVTDWWEQAQAFSPVADFSGWPLVTSWAVALTILFYLVGSLYFLYASRQENAKTRALFHIFISLGAAAGLMVVLQPQHVAWALPLLMVNTSFLFGHFLTFSNSRLSNIFFIVSTIIVCSLIGYNLWML